MKVYICSLIWDYNVVYGGNGEKENVPNGTRIEAEITYPATEKTASVTFRGTVKHKDRICDMNEAKKIVEGIIK
jgi:hypothetical protein